MRDASGCCAEGNEVGRDCVGIVGRGEEFSGAFGLGEGNGGAVEEELFGLGIMRDECGPF